jgi:hypothetical protein
MRLTLHNHKFIDSEDKPIIPNEEYKKLVSLAKEVSLMLHKYSLVDSQKRLVEDILDKNSLNKSIYWPEFFCKK